MIAKPHAELKETRATWRKGYCDPPLDTRLSSLQLRIPKLRQRSYFLPFLEARKTSEKGACGSDPGGRGSAASRLGGSTTWVQAMGLSGKEPGIESSVRTSTSG